MDNNHFQVNDNEDKDREQSSDNGDQRSILQKNTIKVFEIPEISNQKSRSRVWFTTGHSEIQWIIITLFRQTIFGYQEGDVKGWQIKNTTNKECVNFSECKGDKSFGRYQIVFGTGNKFNFRQFLNAIIIDAQKTLYGQLVLYHIRQLHYTLVKKQRSISTLLFLPPYSLNSQSVVE